MRRIQPYFYFAITEYEKKNKKEITYFPTSKYRHKGIHDDLNALRTFIKLEFPNESNWYYIRLPQSNFTVDPGVSSNEKHMIPVKLPFTIDLTNEHIYKLF